MLRILIVGALLLAPLPLFAQLETGPATPAATAPATPETPAAATAEPAAATTPADPTAVTTPVTAPELITDVGKVVDDWKNIGWLAGVIALINLLLNVLRFKPLNDWMTQLDYKWIKPLIATVLGAVLGGFSTFQTGAGALNSIVAGMLAGLGSVGFHELMDNLRKRTRKPPEPPAEPKPAEG